jgi:hypothetical protein
MASANPRSYSGHYKLMPDLLGGDYSDYLAQFDSEGPLAPALLRDALLDAGQDTPKVFLYLGAGADPRICVVHRITRYAPTLGVTTAWDGAGFAMMASGVGAGNQVTLVQFPAANSFVHTAVVGVPAKGYPISVVGH